MLIALAQLGLFTAKAFIIAIMIIIVLIAFFMLLSRGKEKGKTRLVIKNLNEKYEESAKEIQAQTHNKKQLKKLCKEKKAALKAQKKVDTKKSNIFVINFVGDMKATAVANLSEEVTAILSAAAPGDEVFVKIDSGGGLVHTYGLAAAQLMRVRARNIPLTVSIDKVAASGGYLMSCVANKIIAAPFAIVGSIGVVVQLPNFHRILKDKHVEYEMLTAGEYKRTLTLFGENTPEGKEKMQEEINDIHQLFKNLIVEYRPQINIEQVATGEHWLGKQALGLKLIDEIRTSDDYLLERSKAAKLFEICYEIKKPMLSRLTGAASQLREKLLTGPLY
jgi:serine protease SohB